MSGYFSHGYAEGSLCIGVSPTSSFNPLVPDAFALVLDHFLNVSAGVPPRRLDAVAHKQHNC